MSGGAALSRATVASMTIGASTGAAFCIGLCNTAAGFRSYQTVMHQ